MKNPITGRRSFAKSIKKRLRRIMMHQKKRQWLGIGRPEKMTHSVTLPWSNGALRIHFAERSYGISARIIPA
jgi:Txe/YoeB family toxin of Txe-Axe toxin-antitoxin module